MGLKKCHWNKNLNFGNLHVRSWKRSFMKRLKLSFLKTLSTINVGRGLSRTLVRALTMIIYMQRNVLPPKTLIPTQFLRFSPKSHFFHFQSPIILLMRGESGGGVCVCVCILWLTNLEKHGPQMRLYSNLEKSFSDKN